MSKGKAAGILLVLIIFIGLTGQIVPHVSDLLSRVRQLTFWVGGSADKFGIHTEGSTAATSLFYAKNNTTNAYAWLMDGADRLHFGTSGGSSSAVPSMIFRTQNTTSSSIDFFSNAINLYGQRQTTAGSAGRTMHIQSGGATSGATNLTGGELQFIAGPSTGNVATDMVWKAPRLGTSGTADNLPVEQMRLTDATLIGREFSNAVSNFSIFFQKARGTEQNRLPVLVDDSVASFGGFGWVGPTNGFVPAAFNTFGVASAAVVTDTATGLDGYISYTTYHRTAGDRVWTVLNNVGLLTHYGSVFLDNSILGITNLGIGTSTFGTSADRVFAYIIGTEPTTSPADMVQHYAVDVGADGTASLGIRTEEGVATEAVVSDRTLRIKVNGTVYKVLLKS